MPFRPELRCELVEKMEMGWGNTPGPKIPLDWRTRRGPDREYVRRDLKPLTIAERKQRDRAYAVARRDKKRAAVRRYEVLRVIEADPGTITKEIREWKRQYLRDHI